MKALALAVVALVVTLAAGGVAHAADPFAVVPGDDVVVVRLPGAVASGAVVPGDDKLDVRLATPVGRGQRRYDDERVRKIELEGGRAPRVRVKLRGSAKAMRASAAAAIVAQVDGALEIRIPREPGAAAGGEAKPAGGETGGETGGEAKPAGGETGGEAKPAGGEAGGEAKPAGGEAGGEPGGETKPAGGETKPVAAETKPAAKDKPTLGTAPATSLPWGALAALVLVAAVAALVIRQQRRKVPRLGSGQIEIRTAVSLGARARLVLLSANDRELLVSVDASGVRLLDSWGHIDRDGDEPVASAPAPERALPRHSPSVSGLVRLRREAEAPEVAPAPAGAGDVGANGQPDEEWARDFLASLRKGSSS